MDLIAKLWSCFKYIIPNQKIDILWSAAAHPPRNCDYLLLGGFKRSYKL